MCSDISNKSWNEIAFMCKQRNKKQLRECLKGVDRNGIIMIFMEIFNKCITNDDGSCLRSLLPYVSARLKFDDADFVVNYFDLLITSLKKNKKCFEYLISISDGINQRVGYGGSKPILHRACEQIDDVAVGIILKYGANVNQICCRTGDIPSH